MIGQQYECNPVKADMVITDPGAWVFEGAGVTAGQRLVDTVGPQRRHREHPARLRGRACGSFAPFGPERARGHPVVARNPDSAASGSTNLMPMNRLTSTVIVIR